MKKKIKNKKLLASIVMIVMVLLTASACAEPTEEQIKVLEWLDFILEGLDLLMDLIFAF